MKQEDHLYVLAVISNPAEFESRIQLYEQFRLYVEKEHNATLFTAELIYPNQKYRITSEDDPRHLRLVGQEEVWAKENMINLLEKQLPRDWKKLAWIDADVLFARQDWVDATLKELDKHDVVQMFSECRDLTPEYETIPNAVFRGIVQQHQGNSKFSLTDGPYTKRTGHTGYAWACTRSAWDRMGGLIDYSIMGSADYQMCCAWFGDALASTYNQAYSTGYCDLIQEFGDRVKDFSLGYVEGLLVHNYHGAKSNRGYATRWKILADCGYDPKTDLVMERGVISLNPQSERFQHLKEQLYQYFRSRNEDEHLEVKDGKKSSQ